MKNKHFEENETNDSWAEYRRLVLQSLLDLKSDLEKIKSKLSVVDGLEPLKDQFSTLKQDFDQFLIRYEKDYTAFKIKLGAIVSIVTIVVTTILNYLSRIL